MRKRLYQVDASLDWIRIFSDGELVTPFSMCLAKYGLSVLDLELLLTCFVG